MYPTRAIFNLGLWNYSVTRRVIIPPLLAGFLWVISCAYVFLVVLLVLAGQGYQETAQPPTVNFNNTVPGVWYEAFIPDAIKNYTLSTWSCDPNIIRIGTQLLTNNTFLYNWVLDGVLTPAGDDPSAAISYANNLLETCFPGQIILIPPTDLTQTFQSTIRLYCSTTRNQDIVLSTNLEAQINISPQASGLSPGSLSIIDANLTLLMEDWVYAETNLLNSGPFSRNWEYTMPAIGPTKTPVVMEYLSYNEQDVISHSDQFNTPANGSWLLNITTANDETPLQIAFLSDGTVDMQRTNPKDLATANAIIPSGSNNVTFWATVNWFFVSFYWTSLADVGQYAPYNPFTDFYTSPLNNIFVNKTLLDSYINFFETELSPYCFSEISAYNYEILAPYPFPTTLLQSYSCTQITLKPRLTLLLSIVVGCYTFIVGGYGVAKFVVDWWYQYRNGPQANYCDGCLEKTKSSDTGSLDSEDTLVERHTAGMGV